MQIPVYDSHHKIIAVENFEPNLNIERAPSYLNEGGNMGLTRIKKGKYKGILAILFEYEEHPNCSFGRLISDNDAWELCQSRGKMHLIEQLNIDWNCGIIGAIE